MGEVDNDERLITRIRVDGSHASGDLLRILERLNSSIKIGAHLDCTDQSHDGVLNVDFAEHRHANGTHMRLRRFKVKGDGGDAAIESNFANLPIGLVVRKNCNCRHGDFALSCEALAPLIVHADNALLGVHRSE